MHVERNVSNNILRHVMGEKDSPAGRRDMEEAGVFPDLWLHREGPRRDRRLRHAPGPLGLLGAREIGFCYNDISNPSPHWLLFHTHEACRRTETRRFEVT